MESDPGYALQKLDLGILILATDANEIKSRLRYAYLAEFHVIRDEDIPESLRPRWLAISKSLLGKGPRLNDEGKPYASAIDNTLYRMQKKKACEIAHLLIDLADTLRAYLDDLSASR